MNKPVIASPQVTNHILHRFKLRADKKLGQNFLIDENIVRRIVEAAELSPADKVLEVGPGIGTLTQGLAESGADVVAVELDKRLLPVLDVTLEGYDNVRIVNGDILQVNIMETVAAPEFKVCANPAVLYYYADYFCPVGKAPAYGTLSCYGAEGGCRTHGCQTGQQGLWCAFGSYSVLYRAGDSVYRTTDLVYSRTGC